MAERRPKSRPLALYCRFHFVAKRQASTRLCACHLLRRCTYSACTACIKSDPTLRTWVCFTLSDCRQHRTICSPFPIPRVPVPPLHSVNLTSHRPWEFLGGNLMFAGDFRNVQQGQRRAVAKVRRDPAFYSTPLRSCWACLGCIPPVTHSLEGAFGRLQYSKPRFVQFFVALPSSFDFCLVFFLLLLLLLLLPLCRFCGM